MVVQFFDCTNPFGKSVNNWVEFYESASKGFVEAQSNFSVPVRINSAAPSDNPPEWQVILAVLPG